MSSVDELRDAYSSVPYSTIPLEVLKELSPYNYIPTKYITIIFISLFATTTILHLGQLIRYRAWWLLPTIILAGVMETVGWGARLWSSINVINEDAFQIQIIMTVLAPTPLIAANFILLGRVVQELGAVYSRLTPKWYSILFLSADFIALVVQGVGGGLAATTKPVLGGNIMLGGIVFQLIMIVIFSISGIEFFIRYIHDAPVPGRTLPSTFPSRGELSSKLKLMCAALGLSTLVLVVRAIYRTIELADGWNGRIISTEVYFNVLDGAMIIIAFSILNVAHPCRLLSKAAPKDRQDDAATLRGSQTSSRTGVKVEAY